MKKALLIYPEFSPNGFWNYKSVCRLVGKKYPASPLGLATVAALLPQEWDINLIDMNTAPLLEENIEEADLIFIGGMISQQEKFLELIDYIHGFGKKVVVGGPDPTSQPDIYQKANYLVLGEAEQTLPLFIEDYKKGTPQKIYLPPEKKPDMTKSPIPRYDLINFKSYMMIGVQITRGCPFNCEFCDIIELFGRIPRMKTSEQIIKELNTLFNLGYRGHIDFVDDNFIGNKKKVKIILRDILVWSKPRKHPFYFSTEASINLADDDELLDLMRALDFRYVFIGLETADEEVLKATQKYQNTKRKIVDDLNKIYGYGIIVNAGLITGFDKETSAKARSIVDLVKVGKISFAMAGLLFALPNTQLARRLIKTNRYLEESNIQLQSQGSVDQTSAGLNFITDRPKEEIIEDYKYIIEQLYDPREYFDRNLDLALSLRVKPKFKPGFKKIMQNAVAFVRVVFRLGMNSKTGFLFWRNFFKVLFRRPSSLESLINVEAMYIHFGKQSKYIIKIMNQKLRHLQESPEPTILTESVPLSAI